MAERVRVREIDDDDGQRLLRTVRRGTGSVVTWRRAQMVLLSAQGMLVDNIATVTFTSPDRVRDVMHNRHLFAAYDLGKDQLYGHIKKTRNHSEFLELCRYLRSLHPADVRIAIVCDNHSPHLTTKRCQRESARGRLPITPRSSTPRPTTPG
ncbi:hypothetical protein [Streptosporangium sp. NPDC051022]|uniref:hypothetical protein n=1 Tax=Streptosporangium sp. NPDC051022 TaxID=3155752 RepID=UPI0034354600